jgi:AraC family transcriptional activator of mar-sox-rob regulon/AraC family mar-sox-rob regulon transcriptional activator
MPLSGLTEVRRHVRLAAFHGSLADTIGARLESELPRYLTASEIAAEYRLRRAGLDSLFRDRFGMGFHAYFRATRVRRGLDLVLGGMKVEAAARSVGYKSKKDFYRAVKQETGSTPGQLRRSPGATRATETELPAKQGTLFELT